MSKRITITLDDDAAELLRQMAPSQRRQGEFVSSLVRQASNLEDNNLRRQVMQSANELSAIANYLRQLSGAGSRMPASPYTIADDSGGDLDVVAAAENGFIQNSEEEVNDPRR